METTFCLSCLPSAMLYFSVTGIALYACVIGNMVSRGRLRSHWTSVSVEETDPEHIENEENCEDEEERQ